MKVSSIFTSLIFIISAISLNLWSRLPLGNTITTYFIDLAAVIAVIYLYRNHKSKFETPLIVKMYLIWAVICITRGVFVAENYWEWKQWFEKSTTLLLPIFILVFVNKFILQKTLAIWVKFALPLFLLLVSFTVKSAYGFYFAPLIILGLFFPTLTKKWKIILVLLLVFVAFVDPFEARSTFIKYTLTILIIATYYIKYLQLPIFIKTIAKFLTVVPILLLYLGLSGLFNVFDFKSYINVKEDEDTDLSDTRSFIYEEQIASALKNNYVIWGRTPSRGFDSIFGARNAEIIAQAGNTKGVKIKPERGSCEVLFLNVFNYTGIIGVILYGLIYIHGSYLALKKSNNRYIKMVAIYVLFRFAYGWVEDFNRFDIQSLSLMMMIAICYSSQFRKMSNREITYWVRGVFDSRYRRYKLSFYK